MNRFVKYFLVWFVLMLGLYFFYISSMAKSLGIKNRSFRVEDFMEGGIVSAIASIVLAFLSILIVKIIRRDKK